MSKRLLIYFIYFFTETSMVIYQYKEKDLEAKLGYKSVFKVGFGCRESPRILL